MEQKIGTVYNYNQLPDVSKFAFIIDSNIDQCLIRKGQFVHVDTNEGFLIGIIERIVLANEYFSDALTIKAYNSNDNPNIIKGLFPSDDFEFAMAIVKNLGIIKFKDGQDDCIEKIQRMTFPARPGAEVNLVGKKMIENFLGFKEENGLKIGKLKSSEIIAFIDINRLLSKHLAILAISGAGKSYLTSVLLEELLNRKEEQGTPAIVLFDVHGEYEYLKDIPQLKDKILMQDISYFQISVPNLNARSFKKYQNEISNVQVRELSKCIKKLKNFKDERKTYTLEDIINYLENDQEGNKMTKQALAGWLSELNHLNLFGPLENPILNNIINMNQLVIFNLKSEISIRKKQIMVEYVCSRLFYMRRMNKIPPFLLIIEEAHQFAPEAAQSRALSKSIIETIAREGRKFLACLCLISQRPKKLSTTALSQMNSKLILNIKNPYDLKHLMESSEAITKDYVDMISSLSVGEMLLMGNAVNYPIFIDVRERKYKSNHEDTSLEKSCLNWIK